MHGSHSFFGVHFTDGCRKSSLEFMIHTAPGCIVPMGVSSYLASMVRFWLRIPTLEFRCALACGRMFVRAVKLGMAVAHNLRSSHHFWLCVANTIWDSFT